MLGFGPAGMFCGLAMAKMGLKPIIIEQGKKLKRQKILEFLEQGKFKNSKLFWKVGGTFSEEIQIWTMNIANCFK